MTQVTLFSDTFGRANGALGANYGVVSGSTAFVISSDTAVPSSYASDANSLVTALGILTDQWATTTVGAPGTTNGAGVGAIVRGSTSAVTYYRAYSTGGSGDQLFIVKAVAGTFTQLANLAVVLTAGDTLSLWIQGTTLTCYHNGTSVFSTTDSAIASGYPGMCYSSFDSDADSITALSVGNFAAIDSGPRPRRPGPGISPSPMLQFSTLIRDTTFLGVPPALGAAVEGYDFLVATGSTAVSGAASQLEAPDAIAGSGSLTNTGSAAIVENSDSIDGEAQSAGVVAAAAIVENYDIPESVASSAITAAAALRESGDQLVAIVAVTDLATASIAENADAAQGFGNLASAAAGTISENADILQAAGSATFAATASIAESPDTLVGVASAANVAFAATGEGADILVAIGTAVNIGTANIVEHADYLNLINIGFAAIFETSDLIDPDGTSGNATPVQFSYADIIPLSQLSGIQAAEQAYIENTAIFIVASYFSAEGPFVPAQVNYRVDDIVSGINIVPWASLTPGFVNEVTISTEENFMVSDSRNSEQHEILFQITDFFGNVNYAQATFDIIKVTGLPRPNVNIGTVAIVESADGVASVATVH